MPESANIERLRNELHVVADRIRYPESPPPTKLGGVYKYTGDNNYYMLVRVSGSSKGYNLLKINDTARRWHSVARCLDKVLQLPIPDTNRWEYVGQISDVVVVNIKRKPSDA